MSGQPVRPYCMQNLNRNRGKDHSGSVLYPAEDADESAAKVRRIIKAQSADGSSPREREVQKDSEKFEEEARAVHAPPIPMTPTREEVAAHRLTHRPYRAWCPH